MAHGGHCVARHEGQVLFVRHGLPGELAVVEVTSVGRKGRFVRADVVSVVRPSPDRRPAPCAVADRCGGCDWQHATPGAARRLKGDVVREALHRFAGLELPEDFTVSAVPDPGGDEALAGQGLGWRTRGTASADASGALGFYADRSHDVVPVGRCLQLHPRLEPLELFTRGWGPRERVGFVGPALGVPLAFGQGDPPSAAVTELAAGREWAVAANGFWQVHPGAADALVEVVRGFLDPQPGQRLVDLYAGVGLFGISLAAATPGLAVTLVEGDPRAVELAEQNAGELPVTAVRRGVDAFVADRAALAGVDLVVLDPPRSGAGESVVRAVADAAPAGVAYVACDPVALARDLATFGSLGYRTESVVALDLFPTTHHVECVALLRPA